MNNVVELKFKDKRWKDLGKFLHQLAIVKDLYVEGKIDKILIIAEGKDCKCCTSNELNLKTAKAMCDDFTENWKEFIDA
jgi:hypothetical protein